MCIRSVACLLSQWTATLSNSSHCLTGLRELHEKLQLDHEEAKDALSEAQSSAEYYRWHGETLRHRFNDDQAALQASQAQVEERTQQRDLWQHGYESQRDQHQALAKQHDKLQLTLEQKTDAWHDILDQHEDLAAQHTSLKIAYEKEQQALVSSKAHFAGLVTKHDGLVKEHEQLHDAHDRTLSDSQARYASVLVEHWQLQQDFTTKEAALSTVDAWCEELTDEVRQLQEALDTSLIELRQSQSVSTKQLEQLQHDVKLEQEASASSKAQHEEGVLQLEQLQHEVKLEQLQRQVKLEQEASASSKAELEEAAGQLEWLQLELKLEQEASASRKAQHEEAVKQLQQALDDSRRASSGIEDWQKDGIVFRQEQNECFLQACQQLLKPASIDPAAWRNLPTPSHSQSDSHHSATDSGLGLMTQVSQSDGFCMLDVSGIDSLSRTQQQTLADLKQMKGDLTSTLSQLNKLRAESSSICSENDQLHDEVIRLEERLGKIKPKVKKTVKRLQSEVGALRQRHLEATQALHSAQKQLSRLSRLQAFTESAAHRRQGEFDLKLQQAQHAKQEAQQQAQHARQTAQHAQHEQKFLLHELQSVLDKVHSQAEGYLETHKAAKQQLHDTEQQLHLTQQQLADATQLRAVQDAAVSSEHEAQVNELRGRVTDLEQKRAALMSILTELHRLARDGQVSADTLLDIFAEPITGRSLHDLCLQFEGVAACIWT